MSSFSIVVLTYHPGTDWSEWLEAYASQTVKPAKAIVIDSSSDDGTVELASKYGFEVHIIRPSDFDHGKTRQYGIELSGNAEIVVYLTQDAILATPTSIKNLIDSFADPEVGAAYGRQLPRPDANRIAAHAREFNYPPLSHVKSMSDSSKIGIKAVFMSNAFAAYRREALNAVGGFPDETIFAEDQIAAARLMMHGWKLAYAADAKVYHSHNYSACEEFRRYFDIGAFHSRESWMLRQFGHAEGEGARFVQSEMSYLMRAAPLLIPAAIWRTLLKFIAYRLGRMERIFSISVKKQLSMHPGFWKKKSG